MWITVPDQDDNPDNSPKMKIIFVVLFLFLIGELVYFFYIVPNKKITTTIIPTLTATPAPEPTKASTPVSLTTSPAKKPQIALLPEYQGKITELNVFKDIPSSAAKIEFSFKLDVNSGEIIKPQIIFFDKNELKNLKVIDSTGKVISYQDLKVGQNIKFSQKYGLKEKPFFSLEISVLD